MIWEDGTATTVERVPADRRLVVEQPEILSDWDSNGRADMLDAILFAWAWILEFPTADLDGNRRLELRDVDVFLASWWANQPA